MKLLIQRFLLFILLFNFVNTVSAQLKNTNERPKLIVGIVVDQMRWDYLYKYYDRYGNDGFKRMLNEGFTAENTQIPYIPTYTAIGHTCIYTGSVPAIHGICGNNFYIRETKTRMYCAQDDSVNGVGLDPNNKDGKMSPRNNLATTITDELKLATDFKSRVFGVALKDRGAILPAGHFADAAYWMVDGNWITSTFYMNTLPQYIQDFNKADYTSQFLKKGWSTMYPLNTYSPHVPDNNPYEGRYFDEGSITFPINLSEAADKNGRDVIKATPFGNTLTLELSKLILDKEKLGHNPTGAPDFLAISLSSTDYVGHQFAINSAKIEDTYLRLDKDLGDFFHYLDQKVGKGQYTVFLSADHGAAHNPQFIIDEKGNGGFNVNKDLFKDLNNMLEAAFNVKKIIYALTNNQVHLDYQVIDSAKLDAERIKSMIINHLKKRHAVAFAVDMEKVSSATIPDWLKTMTINGYNYKRSGDIQIIFEPQWIDLYKNPTGTTHGAWNPYDSHIPLVFMGWGIKHGNTNAPTYMTDIAPTLAALLHIQAPNGNIGKPIIQVLE